MGLWVLEALPSQGRAPFLPWRPFKLQTQEDKPPKHLSPKALHPKTHTQIFSTLEVSLTSPLSREA